MRGKAMKWSKEHRDVYLYCSSLGIWRRVRCELSAGYDRCTAPAVMPRGTKFDGTAVLRDYEYLLYFTQVQVD